MSVESVFDDGGVLAEKLASYRFRSGQMAMAKTVNDALQDGGQLVLEAGTGIGKTFAYLVPIIESGQSALISTGALALQDQLLHRDIPLLTKALQRTVSVTVLKGRANYICKLALDENDDGGLIDDGDGSDWQRIVRFARQTKDGDVRGATDVAADSPVWQNAISTRESCQVQSCKYHSDGCFLYAARDRAHRADIVIVNHHLFLSDMRLKDEGIAEILPTRDVLLFDEAHLLPQLASQYFGESLSTAKLLRLINDAEPVVSEFCQDASPAISAGNALRRQIQNWLAADDQTDKRLPHHAVLQKKYLTKTLSKVNKALTVFANALRERMNDARAVEKIAARATNDEQFLTAWLLPDTEETEPPADTPTTPFVRWLEQSKLPTLHMSPISGRDIFAKLWQKTKTVLFTSATLSVGGNFEDFCDEVGLANAYTHSWESPYDFANRAVLYMPRALPNPNDPTHTTKLIQATLPLIRANAGRAFVLFSSLRALTQADTLLRETLVAEGFTLLKQGEMSNDELLNRFRTAKCGVLIGSLSFWQGIDVKGEALSLVVVDKIPFTPPDDPMLMARDAWRKAREESPFLRNQLPPAAILIKQVAGRLMRDYDDYGVFMVGDNRLWTRSYGKKIMQTLPPMRQCDDEATVINFIQTKTTT